LLVMQEMISGGGERGFKRVTTLGES